METGMFTMIYREPVSIEAGGYPGLNPRTERADGFLIDYDVAVTVRDGTTMYVNVSRPEQQGRYPALVGWGPYGKHGRLRHDYVSKYTGFEAPDPLYWCRNGYVVINADPRGSWKSEGNVTYYSQQEAEDCYDLIEWAATQGWSNGKLGMLGVSYLAWIQWGVAALNPPHLAAISPWEGVSDFYRELAFHGGIPETGLYPFLQKNGWSFSTNEVEDIVAMAQEHPLFDGYWAGKNADLSKITVPAFVVVSWSDHGLHTRGTLEGFKQIASKDKWLMVHGRKKWESFYQWDNVEKQKQFFNRFLRGVDNRVKYWPKVTLEVRERFFVGDFRTEREWPLARTQYRKLFLNGSDRSLGASPPEAETQARYRVEDTADATQNARFEIEFPERTELTGHMMLKLWVQADGSDDMDLFVAVEKIDRAGYLVAFPFFSGHDDGPVALGWLRVSHRERDEARSTPYQPILKHQREMKLKAGEIVPVEIEILPSSTLFERGEKLRVVVQGSDIYSYADGTLSNEHRNTVNRGEHVLYTGGRYDSHLLVPVIPAY